MCSFVTRRDREKRYQSMVVATWIAVDDVTCRLQEVGSHALSALAAPMAQAVALTAPATLGLFGVSFHEPFHADGGTTVHSRNRAQWAAPGAVTPQLDMVPTGQSNRTRSRTGRLWAIVHPRSIGFVTSDAICRRDSADDCERT